MKNLYLFLLTLFFACAQLAPTFATPENPPPQQATRLSLFNHARGLAHAGEHEEALAAYDSMLVWLPEDPEGRLGRGRVLAWMGHYPQAEKDILFVTGTYPQDSDAWAAQADLYRWWPKAEKSVIACNTWLKLEPNNPDAYIARSRVYMALRRFPDARNDLNTAKDLGGDQETIDHLLAQLDRVPPATKWEAMLWYEWGTMQGLPQHTSHQIRAQVRKRFDRGSIAYGIKWLDQYENRDEGIYFDFYHELWKRAYTNARFELAAKPKVMPQTDSYLALYQGLGTHYEMMASFRYMDYNTINITVYTLGAGIYTGQYYLRAQAYVVPVGENYGHGFSINARRYLGIVDNFIEAGIVRYEDYQLVDIGYLGFDPQGWILNLHAQQWLSKTWGMGMGYSLVNSDEESEPNRRFWRFGIFARW